MAFLFRRLYGFCTALYDSRFWLLVFYYGSLRPLLAFLWLQWILTLTWTKKNLILLVYKRRDVNGKEQKNHHSVVLSDSATSSSSEDEPSKRTALLVHFEGKGPGSIRFGQGLRRLKLSVVPIVSRISDTKFKIVVASASDASAILKCSNRRFTPEEWKVSGESFQITSFEEAKRQQTYSFVIKNVETSITIKEIEQELKLQLTNFKVTRIVSAKTGLPSPLIRVITNNKDEADKCIANGISLAYLHHPCEPSHQRVLQCNKCLKLGHTAGRCLSQLTCLRCGEIGHLATVCKAKEEKCALCGGPHVAVAGNCPKRQEFALKHKAQQQQHQCQQQQQQQPSGRTNAWHLPLAFDSTTQRRVSPPPLQHQQQQQQQLPQQLPVCQHGCAYLPVDVLTRVILVSITSELEIFRGNTSINLHNVINTALMGKQ